MAPGDGVRTAAERAHAAEQQQQQQAYIDTYNLLNQDAVRKAEAAQQASVEQLRADTAKRQEKTKGLKQKAMLVSAENLSKQELIDSMSERLEDMSKELNRLSLTQLHAQKKSAQQTEDEKTTALRNVFEATMDRAVNQRRERAGSSLTQFAQQQQAFLQSAGPKETLVYLCERGQPRERRRELRVRLGRLTTFREVCPTPRATLACRSTARPSRTSTRRSGRSTWSCGARSRVPRRPDDAAGAARRRGPRERGYSPGGGLGVGGGAAAASEGEEGLGAGSMLRGRRRPTPRRRRAAAGRRSGGGGRRAAAAAAAARASRTRSSRRRWRRSPRWATTRATRRTR